MRVSLTCVNKRVLFVQRLSADVRYKVRVHPHPHQFSLKDINWFRNSQMEEVDRTVKHVVEIYRQHKDLTEENKQKTQEIEQLKTEKTELARANQELHRLAAEVLSHLPMICSIKKTVEQLATLMEEKKGGKVGLVDLDANANSKELISQTAETSSTLATTETATSSLDRKWQVQNTLDQKSPPQNRTSDDNDAPLPKLADPEEKAENKKKRRHWKNSGEDQDDIILPMLIRALDSKTGEWGYGILAVMKEKKNKTGGLFRYYCRVYLVNEKEVRVSGVETTKTLYRWAEERNWEEIQGDVSKIYKKLSNTTKTASYKTAYRLTFLYREGFHMSLAECQSQGLYRGSKEWPHLTAVEKIAVE